MRLYAPTPILSLLLLGVTLTAQAQATCPALVEDALTLSQRHCSGLEGNQACYGHEIIVVEPASDDIDLDFDESGDLVELAHVHTLTLSAMDLINEEWGVALLQIRANLPQTLPGQNIMFVLFGDVMMEEASTAEALADNVTSPMQSFYLTTGVGVPQCAEAPESGILIQTPEGTGRMSLTINGVDVHMGSTIYVQAQPGGVMTLFVLEGRAIVRSLGVSRTVLAGSVVEIMLGDDLLPTNAPGLPQAYDLNILLSLPLVLLNAEITLALPLDDSALEALLAEDQITFGDEDGGIVIGDEPILDWDTTYQLDPYCIMENPSPADAEFSQYVVLVSYGFDPGNPADHELGLSAADLMNRVTFDVSMTNVTLSLIGERFMFAYGGQLHIGEYYNVGSLASGDYTISVTTGLNDFSSASSCTYTIP